jgi:hypothetical protein
MAGLVRSLIACLGFLLVFHALDLFDEYDLDPGLQDLEVLQLSISSSCSIVGWLSSACFPPLIRSEIP